MGSLRVVPYPPEHKDSQTDNCCSGHLSELPRRGAKYEGDDHSHRDGSKHKACCQGRTDETHHQEANGNKQSGELRVYPHHPPGAGMSVSVAFFHWLIVPPVQTENHLRVLIGDKSP